MKDVERALSNEADGQLTLGQLEDLMRWNGVPLEEWGQGEAKTLAQLHEEISTGYSELLVGEAGELSRKLKIVLVDVYCRAATGAQLRLCESRQYPNGYTSERPLRASLATKAKRGEDVYTAAERTLQTGIGATEMSLTWTGYAEPSLEPSVSYPGLMDVRETYHMTAQVPLQEYVPDGYQEVRTDRTSSYRWLEVPQSA